MNALVSNVLTQVFITLIAVSGIYVLTGLTGMFSLGQAAFMASAPMYRGFWSSVPTFPLPWRRCWRSRGQR